MITPYSNIISVTTLGLLLDYYPNSAAAYSLRKLRSAYTGSAIRVRRSSDNTELNIGFEDGQLDTATLLAFCGAGNGFVTTLYDQSGNSYNAVQTTAVQQPQIVSSGSVILENGKPSIEFDGVDDNLRYNSSIGISGSDPRTLISIFQPDNNDNGIVLHHGDNTTNLDMQDFNFTIELANRYFGSNNIFGISDTNQMLVFNPLVGDSAWDTKMYKNGVELTYTTRGDDLTLDTIDSLLIIGVLGKIVPSNYFDGKIQEIIYYPTDQSLNRLPIGSNININYNIFWDGTQNSILNTYSGSSVGFSLRALNKNYVGPLIRVRRSSDNAEMDIFARYDGTLNISQLESFCSGANGFVTTWYDQSGNDNNATQSIATNQPQIVSSGSVILDGGKPSCQFDGVNDGLFFDSSGLDIGSLSSFVVGKYNALGLTMIFGISGATNNKRWYAPYATDTTFRYGYADNTTAVSTSGDLNKHLFTMIAGSTLGNMESWVDGSSIGTYPLSSGIDARNGIGNFDNGNYADCKIQEIIIYPSDQSVNRANIESDINDYYGIY